MRITLLAIGSRGDVQPLVALGGALDRAGHRVRVATSPEFADLVRGAGLDFSPAGPPATGVLSERGGRKLVSGAGGPVVQVLRLRRVLIPLIDQLLEDLRHAAADSDALLFTPLVNIGDIAQHVGVPAMMVSLWPKSRTSAFPAIGLPRVPLLDGPYNRLTHMLLEQLSWRPFQRAGNRARKAIGLPPMRWGTPLGYAHRHRWPVLYGFSETVVPRPADWGPWLHVTGYWCTESAPGWEPPARLLRFLDAGEPPVVITFGSMTAWDPAELARTAAEALRLAGRRGVLVGDLDLGGIEQGDRLLHVQDIPHDWLFPRAAAVVHHAGAGTAAAALRAGVPNVTVPFFADQPFWAERINALSASPDPLPRSQLTPERLAEEIRETTQDPSIAAGARRVGEQLRAEDSLGKAVRVVEQHIGARPAVR